MTTMLILLSMADLFGGVCFELLYFSMNTKKNVLFITISNN